VELEELTPVMMLEDDRPLIEKAATVVIKKKVTIREATSKVFGHGGVIVMLDVTRNKR
jgi:hypothetical protein